MFSVEVCAKVRRAVLVDGVTRREAARIYCVHRNTISKMLAYPVPPGYRRKAPRVSVKLDTRKNLDTSKNRWISA